MIYLFLFFLISHYAIQGIYCAVDQRHICARMHRTCPNIEPQRYKLFLNASLFFQKNEQICPRASLHSTLSIRPLSAASSSPKRHPFCRLRNMLILSRFSKAPPTPLQPLSISALKFFGDRLERGWRGVGGALEIELVFSGLRNRKNPFAGGGTIFRRGMSY